MGYNRYVLRWVLFLTVGTRVLFMSPICPEIAATLLKSFSIDDDAEPVASVTKKKNNHRFCFFLSFRNEPSTDNSFEVKKK